MWKRLWQDHSLLDEAMPRVFPFAGFSDCSLRDKTSARTSHLTSRGRGAPTARGCRATSRAKVFMMKKNAGGEITLPRSMSPGGALFFPSGLRQPLQSHHRELLHGARMEKPFMAPFSGPVGTIVLSLLASSASQVLYRLKASSVWPPTRPNRVVWHNMPRLLERIRCVRPSLPFRDAVVSGMKIP